MKKTAILTSLVLGLVLCLPAVSQQGVLGGPPTMTFEAALAKVVTYEVGDSRTALVDLEKLVMAAAPSPERVKPMEQALIKALEGKATLAGKDQICRRLRVIGSAATVPALVKMLGAEDTADMARYALERMPAAAVNPALRGMLPKTSGKVQIGIANTLGRRKDAGAVAALRALIPGRDPAVAAAAAAALGQIGDVAAAAALTAVRPKTSGALRAEVGDASLYCAEQMFEKGNNKGAFAIFKELNAPSEPELIRIGALRGLAMSGGKEAVPVLSAALKASEPKVRAQAIRQLSTIPGAEVTTALGQALAGMDTLGKVRVLAALVECGDKGAVPMLLMAAKDPAQPVRVAALLGLGKLGDASVILLLAETAAKEADTAEQTAAVDFTVVRPGVLAGGQIAPSPDVTEQAAAEESLSRMRGADIDKAILTGIATAEPKTKIELIKATSERGLSAATPTLIKTAADSNPGVRRAALRALRGTAGSADVPALIDLLRMTQAAADRAEVVRALASALRRSDTASLSPVMSAYQSTSDAELRGWLLTVLAQTGKDESLPVLRGALKDSNTDIRRGAILALSEWPNATPLPELLGIAKSEPNPALQVLSLRGYIRLVGLSENRPPAETLKMLSQAMSLAKQADEKKAVLSLLPLINSPDALALAEAAINDPEVASEARMAADRIRQRRVPGRKQP